jgi:hypothetical protein
MEGADSGRGIRRRHYGNLASQQRAKAVKRSRRTFKHSHEEVGVAAHKLQ